MVRHMRGEPGTWVPPRGPRNPDGTWRWTLPERPSSPKDSDHWAVENYQDLMSNIGLQRRRQGLTVRALAKGAGLSLGVTSDALNGSSWPRWSTMEAIAGAIGHELWLSGKYEVPLYELPFLVGDRERSMTFAAREIGVRPETLLEMTRGERSPLASTVLALTDWCNETMTLEPRARTAKVHA